MDKNIMISWKENLEKLKNEHKKIAQEIVGMNIAYIDIPFHYNTGDLLIYFGTEEFIKENEINISYRAIQNTVKHDEIKKCDTIFVHGGGNFGDIYLTHHRNREKLLEKYKDKRIIFLPQSIHFNNEKELEITRNFFSKLNDVVLYVRDIESYEVGKTLTINTVMMPDMAHSMHPLIEESEISVGEPKRILNLIRKDQEFVSQNNRLNKRGFDWADLVSTPDKLTQVLLRKSSKLDYLKPIVTSLWLNQVNYNVTAAINYVDGYDSVHTDRLHGFLLSYLLGKNVCLYDNTYSKIARYKNAWLNDCGLIKNGLEIK